MCEASLVICCTRNWEVTPSLLESSYTVMSLLYQRLDFALKSSRMTKEKYLPRQNQDLIQGY